MCLRHRRGFRRDGGRVSGRLIAIVTLGYIHVCMFSDSIIQALTDHSIPNTGKQSSRNFFWKSLTLFIWITDRHSQNSLLKALIFFVRMSFYQKCHPSLKPYGGKTGYIRSLVVSLLDEMMLATKVSIHSRY